MSPLDGTPPATTHRGRVGHRGSRAASELTSAQSNTSAIDESIALLALASIKGVDYWTLWKLAQKRYSFASLLNDASEEEVRGLLKAAGAQLAKPGQVDWSAAKSAIIRRAKDVALELSSTGTQIVHRGDPAFPVRLEDLSDAPHWLFVQGKIEVLHKPSITVVGTRSPTDDGMWLTRFVGGCLHELGCPTVSGLATGIDQLIHQASIKAAVPTIAVLGNGIFNDYPKGSEPLRAQILAKGGAIVSEYLPHQSFSAENFVRRNRLQAALGCALVPTEWAAKSGTAHTVKYAADLGRPIACLRLPDWTESRVALATIKGEAKALFTVPGEEKKFRTYLAKALRAAKTRRPRQPDLFNRE